MEADTEVSVFNDKSSLRSTNQSNDVVTHSKLIDIHDYLRSTRSPCYSRVVHHMDLNSADGLMLTYPISLRLRRTCLSRGGKEGGIRIKHQLVSA